MTTLNNKNTCIFALFNLSKHWVKQYCIPVGYVLGGEGGAYFQGMVHPLMYPYGSTPLWMHLPWMHLPFMHPLLAPLWRQPPLVATPKMHPIWMLVPWMHPSWCTPWTFLWMHPLWMHCGMDAPLPCGQNDWLTLVKRIPSRNFVCRR